MHLNSQDLLGSSSPIKQSSKGKISSFLDQDLSGSRGGQSGFHLEVEQIAEKFDSSHSNQKQSLNSGGTNLLGDLGTLNKKVDVASGSRNYPTLNVGSFSAVDDSTLQLDTIALIKPVSTKNVTSAVNNKGIELDSK